MIKQIMNNLFKLWNKIDDKIRFLLIGALNAAISMIFFVAFIRVFGEEHPLLCVALQWIFSSPISYLTQKFFVFNTRGNYVKEYLKCCSTWAISCLLNEFILKVIILKYCVATLNTIATFLNNIQPFEIKSVDVAQFISLFIVAVVTYVLFKYFAFKAKH